MKFLLVGKQGTAQKRIIVTEEQAVSAVEHFHRIAVSMDETSYHLTALGVINTVKQGTAQAMTFNNSTLSVHRYSA